MMEEPLETIDLFCSFLDLKRLMLVLGVRPIC